MEIFVWMLLLVSGLAIGSFLNAVVWRVREGMSLWGRSMCPRCRHQIAWYDNVPVLSYILLRGRCRKCRSEISWKYPVGECTLAGIFLVFGNTFLSLWDIESWFLTFFYLVVASIGMLVFFYDLETMEIPNIFLWIGVGFSLVMLLILDLSSFSPVFSPWSLRLHSGIFAGCVSFLPLFLMATLSREKWMGMGDGFLAFFLSLAVGWPKSILMLFFSFTVGAAVGIILLSLRKKKMGSQIPFGPFLVVGAILAILVPEYFPGLFPWVVW